MHQNLSHLDPTEIPEPTPPPEGLLVEICDNGQDDDGDGLIDGDDSICAQEAPSNQSTPTPTPALTGDASSTHWSIQLYCRCRIFRIPYMPRERERAGRFALPKE